MRSRTTYESGKRLCRRRRKSLFWNTFVHLFINKSRLFWLTKQHLNKNVMGWVFYNFILSFNNFWTKDKNWKNYKIESVTFNNRVRIISCVTVQTQLRLEHLKPHLLVHDLRLNKIKIIQFGITNKRIFEMVETKTRRKD